MSKFEAAMIALFLSAIVAANLAVTHWGQVALPFTAFLLIPFDLVTRDALHEVWEDRGTLEARMAGLIVAGAILTVALNTDAMRVALASCVAFTLATTANTIGFARLKRRGRFVRMNASNAVASVLDSIAFPLVAFGWAGTSWSLSATQAGSKFAGGLVFSSLFIYVWKKRNEEHRV